MLNFANLLLPPFIAAGRLAIGGEKAHSDQSEKGALQFYFEMVSNEPPRGEKRDPFLSGKTKRDLEDQRKKGLL